MFWCYFCLLRRSCSGGICCFVLVTSVSFGCSLGFFWRSVLVVSVLRFSVFVRVFVRLCYWISVFVFWIVVVSGGLFCVAANVVVLVLLQRRRCWLLTSGSGEIDGVAVVFGGAAVEMRWLVAHHL